MPHIRVSSVNEKSNRWWGGGAIGESEKARKFAIRDNAFNETLFLRSIKLINSLEILSYDNVVILRNALTPHPSPRSEEFFETYIARYNLSLVVL